MRSEAVKKRMLWSGVPDRVLILDIEASGLYAGSFPIEIAYADPLKSWVDASLICPDPSWEGHPWDQQIEALTGITREMLASAPPASEVAKKVAEDLSQADLILSDAPVWDLRWLERLLSLNDTPVKLIIKDFQSSLDRFNPLRRYLSTHRCLNIYDKSEHRAGGDVIRLLRVYRRALPIPLWEEQYCPIKKRGFGQGESVLFVPGLPE
ncbi:MAG: hypothetical protein HQL72_11750 [Magnetococcales bacterium]|nr:hypothetical protein [Magnetococcales bacterium]